jgi:hypothetical protein
MHSPKQVYLFKVGDRRTPATGAEGLEVATAGFTDHVHVS